MMPRSVAITGAGLVTPLGVGVAANLAALHEGRCGLQPAPESIPWWTGRVAGPALPEDLPAKLLGQSKYLNRGGVLAVQAAGEALRQAAPPEEVAPPRRSVYVATGDLNLVGCDFLHPAIRESAGSGGDLADPARLNRHTVEQVNPFFLLETLSNNPFSFLTALCGAMGPGTSLAGQSPCGSNALELAFRAVRHGRADLAVAAGSTSWVNPVALFEMEGLGLLSRGRAGAGSFRPLDRRRDGFLPGEGGAALVLEPLEQARARGAAILGEVLGVANTARAMASLAVAPRVTYACLAQAISDAGRSPAELGFVCPHGSGTVKGDRSELAAVREFLGAAAGSVPVCALKPYTGHMGAASDLAEVVFGLEAARTGRVPATPNFQAAEAGFEGLRISAGTQECRRPLFLSASYGLGGQCSAVVVSAV